ncbi:MAG: helix-turn-helix domain-containing protein [Phycisphaerales bacterium]
MPNPYPLSHLRDAGRIALSPAELADALGLSERTIWGITAPRGTLPAVKVGRRVVYPIVLVEKWLAEEAAKGGAVT